MVFISSKCGWIQSRNYYYCRAESPVYITNGHFIYDLTKFLAPYPTQTALVKEAQCCLETMSDPRGAGVGGGGGGYLGITAKLRDKRDIVAQADPSKKT